MATALWAMGLVLLASLVGSFGPILLKKGSDDFTFNIRKFIRNKPLIGGIFFYGMSTVIFLPALRGGELSILYPLVATSYIWVSLLSVKFLNEKMNTFKWFGITLIIVGVTFIGIGS